MTRSRPGASGSSTPVRAPTTRATTAATSPTPGTTAATSPTPATPATTRGTKRATTAPPSAEHDAAALTVEPVGLDAFLADHWERRPLLVRRAEPGRFDGILAAADVERMVCEGGIRVPAFRLVRDGEQLPA